MLWLLTTLFDPGALAGVPSPCPTLDASPRKARAGGGRLEGTPGERRVALVVGVGDYAATLDGRSIDIPAASTDAQGVRDLLVDTFGFPARNVCLLRDQQATRRRFFEAYDATFAGVVPGDEVVLYFAGHGSRTPGRDQTYVMHDSRTKKTPDVASVEIERRLVATYDKTPNVTVLIDASHGGGPLEGRPSEVVERWVPHAPDAPTQPLPDNPRIARLMPDMVWLHAAPDGMPALERDGHGVFTAGLLRALRGRPDADWGQVFQDVARWTAALHSWQQPTAGGNLARPVWSRRGPTSTLEVVSVEGKSVVLRGPSLPGISEGALLSTSRGDEVAIVEIGEVGAGTAEATVFGEHVPEVGASVDLTVPGRDLTAVEVAFQGSTDWTQRAQASLAKLVQADPVLVETVRFVERGADFLLRPGPDGTIDIVGADGVRRNRFGYDPGGEGLAKVAEALGLYARQAALLALSGEIPPDYPRDMFEVRVLPAPTENQCSRRSYVAPERAVPWTQVPMCNGVKLSVRLVETPKQPLHLGILYLSGNGHIDTWPGPGRSLVLAERGDEHVQVLGWVTPPLNTPDRILVFGTHEPVNWSRLEGRAPSDRVTRGIGGDDFFVAAVAGSRTRSAFVGAGYPVPAWTASLLSVEVTADPERWSPEERESVETCRNQRRSACAGE